MTGSLVSSSGGVAASRETVLWPVRSMVAATAAMVLLCAACSGVPGGSSQTSVGASPSSSSSVTISSGLVTPSSSQSASPISAAGQEAIDRAAVEQAWTTYWQIHQGLLGKPAADWPAAVGAVAVDPTRQQVLDEAKTFTSSGMGFYGQVVNHPYWSSSIDGRDLAVMGDCMDTSRYGTLVVKTGVKRTVGRAKDNTRATFRKGEDGTWRVQKIEFLVDTPC
jgi:hypothetical protein